MGTSLVPYQSMGYLIKHGLYFQLWMRLMVQAKRVMRRRHHYLVTNNKVEMKP